MKKFAIVAAVLSIFCMGAASQYVYTKTIRVDITQAKAAQGANWFIAEGAWDGTAAEMNKCCIGKVAGNATGFGAWCSGDDTVPADSLPEGAKVKEVIN